MEDSFWEQSMLPTAILLVQLGAPTDTSIGSVLCSCAVAQNEKKLTIETGSAPTENILAIPHYAALSYKAGSAQRTK